MGDESDTMALMTGPDVEAAPSSKDRCHYPGCTRVRRPDPATGRPTRYCGEADPDGGPVHTPASAWKARNAQRDAAVTTQEPSNAAAPVSLARATLEQRLEQLPEKFGELREYLDSLLAGIREAGDVEAAGAEVEDAHRDALTKVTEADRRTAAAERNARLAEERAADAERDRQEADALVEDAMSEMARIRDETTAEVARIRAEAEAAINRAQEQVTEAEDEHRRLLAERDTQLEQARQDVTTAQVAAAAAQSGHQAADAEAARERQAAAELRAELEQVRRDADSTRQRLQAQVESARDAQQVAAADIATTRAELATAQAQAAAAQRAIEVEHDTVLTLRQEIDRQRADTQSERETLRANHAEQLAQAERNADDRVQALTEALAAAREVAATYRAQLGTAETSGEPRKRSPRTTKRDTTKRDDGDKGL